MTSSTLPAEPARNAGDLEPETAGAGAIKNISTRLAGKVAEARARSAAAASGKPDHQPSSADPTPAAAGPTTSTEKRPQFTPVTTVLAGRVGQTRGHVARTAADVTAGARQEPRRAWTLVGAAALVFGWLTQRALRRPPAP